MSKLQIRYAPRQNVTPESEVAALASVYHFILDTASKKTAAYAPGNGLIDAKESSEHGLRATTEYTE